MRISYLDNSATTKVSQKAADFAYKMMTQYYGNPSSLHSMGIEAEKHIEDARECIAESMSVNSKNIYFTSGSTETNNTVLFGVADKLKRSGNRIIVSAVEHPSVYESAIELRRRGYDVIFAPVDKNGVVILDELEKAVTDDTVLVSIMYVNNETGAIQPIDQISKIVKSKSSAYIHCDCVQAYGKLPLKPKKWNVDFVSVSAHKVHGPKGVGALYISDNAKLTPLLYGGEQQKKIRPGTEAAPLIAGFFGAVSEFDINGNLEYIKELNSYAVEKLSNIDGVTFNAGIDALPYIINISVDGIKSETMLHYLETQNVFVSSSSACAKGKKSYVLKAMGVADSIIDCALRISFSKYNTKEDIDALTHGICDGLKTLARIKR